MKGKVLVSIGVILLLIAATTKKVAGAEECDILVEGGSTTISCPPGQYITAITSHGLALTTPASCPSTGVCGTACTWCTTSSCSCFEENSCTVNGTEAEAAPCTFCGSGLRKVRVVLTCTEGTSPTLEGTHGAWIELDDGQHFTVSESTNAVTTPINWYLMAWIGIDPDIGMALPAAIVGKKDGQYGISLDAEYEVVCWVGAVAWNTGYRLFQSETAWAEPGPHIWHLACGRHGSGNVRVYVNGLLWDTKAMAAGSTSPADLVVGEKWTGLVANGFNGFIDDVIVFDAIAGVAGSIPAIMDDPSVAATNTANRKFIFDADPARDGSSLTVDDSSTPDVDGTLFFPQTASGVRYSSSFTNPVSLDLSSVPEVDTWELEATDADSSTFNFFYASKPTYTESGATIFHDAADYAPDVAIDTDIGTSTVTWTQQTHVTADCPYDFFTYYATDEQGLTSETGPAYARAVTGATKTGSPIATAFTATVEEETVGTMVQLVGEDTDYTHALKFGTGTDGDSNSDPATWAQSPTSLRLGASSGDVEYSAAVPKSAATKFAKLSIRFWFSPARSISAVDQIGEEMHLLAFCDGSTTDDLFLIEMRKDASTGIFRFYNNLLTVRTADQAVELDPNKWYYFQMRYTKGAVTSDVEFAINGVQVGTTQSLVELLDLAAQYEIRVGTPCSGGGDLQTLLGTKMHDIRFYYDETFPVTPPTAGPSEAELADDNLLIYIPFDEGTGVPQCKKCLYGGQDEDWQLLQDPGQEIPQWRRRNEPMCSPDPTITGYQITAKSADIELYETVDGVTKGSLITVPSATISSTDIRVIVEVTTVDLVGSGAASFSYLVVDDDNNLSTAKVVTLDITDVNDAPSAFDVIANLVEDTPQQSIILFGNDTESGTSVTYRITSVPTLGQLLHPVSFIPINGPVDLATNEVLYSPVVNDFGTAYATFDYIVRDPGLRESGKALVQVNVAASPDDPTTDAVTPAPTVEENGKVKITFVGHDVDQDNNLSFLLITAGNPSHGTLRTASDCATAVPVGAPQAGVAVDADTTQWEFWFCTFPGYDGAADPFTWRVRDTTSRESSPDESVIVTITPFNDPPTANNISRTFNEDVQQEFCLTGSDPEGGSLTFFIASIPSKGTLTQKSPTTDPILLGNTEVTDAGDCVLYTPFQDQHSVPIGSEYDSFSFQSQDPGGKNSPTAFVSMIVTPQNDPPVATPGLVFTGNEGASFIPITLEATDPDGHVIAGWIITALPTQPGTTLCYDPAPPGGPFGGCGAALVGVPQAEPNFAFFAPTNDNGDPVYDTFSFQVRDSTGDVSGAESATIRILPVNDLPTGQDFGVVGNEDEYIAVDFTTFMNDIDGDDVFVVLVTPPTGGTLHFQDTFHTPITFASPLQLTNTKVIDFLGPQDAFGGFTFTYRVRDATGADSAFDYTVTVTVNAVNDAPVAFDDTVDCDEDSSVPIDLLGSDVDNAVATAQRRIESIPALGELRQEGGPFPGALIGAPGAIPTSQVRYIPPPDQNGNSYASFTFSLSDGSAQNCCSNNATITINVIPQPDRPVAIAVTENGLTEDTLGSVTLNGSDVDGDSVVGVITVLPPDGTLYQDSNKAQPITAGQLPLTLGSLTVFYQGDLNYNGADWFSFRVWDGGLMSLNDANATLTIAAVNDAPVPRNLTKNANEGIAFFMDFATAEYGSDPEGDAYVVIVDSFIDFTGFGALLEFRHLNGTWETWTAGMAGDILPTAQLRFTSSLGQFASPYAEIQYRLRDTETSVQVGVVTLNVDEVNDPPIPFVYTVTTAEDTPITIFLNGSDDGTGVMRATVVAPLNLNGGSLTQIDLTPIPVVPTNVSFGDVRRVIYTPPPDANGASFATVSFDLSDTELTSLSSGVVTIDVSPRNDPPQAQDTELTVAEGSTGTAVPLSATDIDNANASLSFVIDFYPDDGRGVLLDNGTPIDPSSDLPHAVTGPLTFDTVGDVTSPYPIPLWVIKYHAVDPEPLASNIAHVVVFVDGTDDPPVATDVYVMAPEDEQLIIDLAGSDVDMDALSFSLADISGLLGTLYPTLTGTSPCYSCGALTVGPTIGSISASYPSTVIFEPLLHDTTPTWFDFQVSSTSLSDIGRVNITFTAQDDPPYAFGSHFEVLENTNVTVYLAGDDPDTPDGDLLAYISQWPRDPSGSANATIGKLFDGNGVELTADLSWRWVNGRNVTFQPNPDESREGLLPYAQFRFQLYDNTSFSNEALVRIFVRGINQEPVVPNITGIVWFEDEDNFFIPPYEDSPGLPSNWTSGDPLPPGEFPAADKDGPNKVIFTVTRLPDNGTLYQSQAEGIRNTPILNPGTPVTANLIYVSPLNDGNFSDYFCLSAFDGADSSASDGCVYFTVQLLNDPPVTQSRTTTVVGGRTRTLNLTLDVTDAENDPLSYFIADSPIRGTLFEGVDTSGTVISVNATAGDPPFALAGDSVTYEPNDQESTPSPFAEFFWFASDGKNISQPNARVTIDRIKNVAPAAINLNIDGIEDFDTVIILRGTDREGDPLTAFIRSPPLRGTLFQYNAANDSAGVKITPDCDNCLFNETLVTDTFTDAFDGVARVLFRPAPDDFSENGTSYAQFTYIVKDTEDLPSGLATVTINILSQIDLPRASNVSVTVREEDEKNIVVEAVDPEDSDDLEFRITSVTTKGQLFQTNTGVDRQDEVMIPDADGNPYDILKFKNQFVVYTSGRVDGLEPDLDQFTFVLVADANGTSARTSNTGFVFITVLPVNDQPVAFDLLDITVLEDSNVTIFLNGTDRDLNDRGNLQATIKTLPEDGTLFQFNSDPGADLDQIVTPFTDLVDNDLYRVIYRPPQDGVGSPFTEFTYFMSDGQADSLEATVRIHVISVNDPPTTANVPAQLKGLAGSDLLIELGGADVDDQDEILAIVVDPRSESMVKSGSKLHFALPNNILRDHLNFTIAPTRGPEITEDNTTLDDPDRRVILDMQSQEGARATVTWRVMFTDGTDFSGMAPVNVVVSRPDGTVPSGYDKPWPKIVAIVLNVVGCIVGIIVAGLMIWRRNRTRDDSGDYMDLPFVNDSSESSEHEVDVDGGVTQMKPRDPLEQLILDPDYQVVKALLEVIDVTEYDALAKSLVNIFEFHELTLVMLKYFITQEVNGASSAGTLFRANSISSKMMTQYSKMIGQQYLRDTLRSPINTVISMPEALEVDPRKLKGGAKPKHETLHKTCQNFLDWITSSTENSPVPFRVLSHHLFFQVGRRFPASKHTAVGGFLFLRFFCPAVISPEGFKVVEQPPPPHARRSLVLIAKALQNLSNGVVFGNKEAYMIPLNSFVEKNADSIQTFFDSMVRTATQTSPSLEVDPEVLGGSLKTVQEYLFENKDRIIDVLEGRGGDDYSQRTDTSQTSRTDRSRTHGSGSRSGSLIAPALGGDSATDHTDISHSSDDDDLMGMKAPIAASSADTGASGVPEVFYGADGEQYILAGEDLSEDDEILYEDEGQSESHVSVEELGTETARALGIEVDAWTNLSDISGDWEEDVAATADNRLGINPDGSIPDPVFTFKRVLAEISDEGAAD